MANNHLIVTWMKHTIDPKLKSNISHRDLAKDLWDHIKKRFALKSGARYQQLRIALANCRQSGSTVEDYFGRLTKIWDGMTDCLTVKSCSCNRCTCDLASAREKEADVIRVHDFLFGLDEASHGSVRSQICAQIPLPDLDTVYQTIVQNETVNSNTRKDEPPVMSFAAQTTSNGQRRGGSENSGSRGRSGANGSNGVICSSCGQSGHLAATCFKVIGFPEWWGDRPRNRNSGPGAGGGNGNRGTARANVSQIIGSNSEVAANATLTDSDRQGITGFYDAQWQTLMTMFQPNSSSRLSGPHSEDADWSG